MPDADLARRGAARNLLPDESRQSGRRPAPRTFCCRDVDAVHAFFEVHRPFRAVIEASSSYRWLYGLLAPLGEVVLARMQHS